MQSAAADVLRMLRRRMTRNAPKPDRPRDLLASLPRLDRHRPRGGVVRPSRVSRWRAAVLLLVHAAIAAHIAHWLVAGETLAPVEPSEAMQTIELGRVNAGFVLFVVLIVATALFGRWFCGWGCHVVALQDLCAWLLGRFGLRPKPVRSRLLVLTPWVVGGYMFVWPALAHAFGGGGGGDGRFPSPAVWRSELLTTELWQTFPGPTMAIATFVVAGFLMVWWLGAKGFCTYGCPYGAFFATVDRVAPVRIVVDKDACEACGHCTSACSSNVRVHEEVARHGKVVDPGCMKCLDCVSVCPKDALSVGFAAPQPFATSQQRIQARADFRWWEEMLLAVVAVWAAEWVFRGAWFGERVPLLLAVGLGIFTAVFALLLVRLVTRPDVGLQYATLRERGRWTRQGRVALGASVCWVLFAVHTQVVTGYAEDALAASREPVRQRLYAPAAFNGAAAARALEDVDRAIDVALVADPVLSEARGLLLAALQRDADAERQLRLQFDTGGGLVLPESRLVLARYWALSGTRLEDAVALVEPVVGDPRNPGADVLLQRIRQRQQQQR